MSAGPRVLAARRAVLALVALLAALLVGWHATRFSAPTAALVLALALSPWVLPLRGLLRLDRRTYAATTLLTLPYLGYGLMETVANPGARGWAAATTLAAFGLFVALVAFLRVSHSPGA